MVLGIHRPKPKSRLRLVSGIARLHYLSKMDPWKRLKRHEEAMKLIRKHRRNLPEE